MKIKKGGLLEAFADLAGRVAACRFYEIERALFKIAAMKCTGFWMIFPL